MLLALLGNMVGIPFLLNTCLHYYTHLTLVILDLNAKLS